MRRMTLFALTALVPLTACIELDKGDDDDEDEDEDDDDTGSSTEEESDTDTDTDSDSDTDSDTDSDSDTDTDTDADYDVFTGGTGSASYSFESEEFTEAGYSNCTASFDLVVTSGAPAGCSGCTHAGTVAISNADDNCDWGDNGSPGDWASEINGNEITYGIDTGNQILYIYAEGSWYDLNNEGYEPSFSGSQVSYSVDFPDDGFTFNESITLYY